MRICLGSSDPGPAGEIGAAVARLARLLAGEHEVTVVHAHEDAAPATSADDPPGLRHVVFDPARLPQVAYSCEDHARSAALLATIEDAYGDDPPDYVELGERRGHALVPLQAKHAGHRSLRGSTVAVRLVGSEGLAFLRDGTLPRPAHRMILDLEREALRLADEILWPGGDVLELYRPRLDTIDFGAARRLRVPHEPGEAQVPAPRHGADPLRILCAGPLRRVEGVLELVEACLELDSPDWRLTLIGEDTETAPLARSVRATIEVMGGGDERIEIVEPLRRERLRESLAEHDLLVLPPSFAVWPEVALEGMRAGVPILATAVGGLTELVADGVTGWHAAGTDSAAIRASLERLLADRGELERVRASGEPQRRLQLLGGSEQVLGGYRQLLASLRPRQTPAGRASEPLVTGVVTYFGEHESVGEAVGSLLAQTHRRLEVLIVNDGSFQPEDGVLDELVELDRVRVLAKPNQGESSARNLGALDADGSYVAFLDSDNVYEPEFVERAVAMLEADSELPYVTCWLRFFDGGDGAFEQVGIRGYAPLGNAVRSDDAVNSDGDAIAVMPRRLFAPEGFRYEESAALLADWEFYRRLRDAGRFGAVIPEQLARYRVRAGSLSRSFGGPAHAQSWDEALSRRLLGRTLRTAIA